MTNPTDLVTTPLDDKRITKTITINASPATVWAALTEPALMQKWMVERESEIEIRTDWQIGQPLIIRGHLHRIKFETKGLVLQFQPEHLLQYTHWASISRLPDEPANYTVIEFRLTPVAAQTSLTVTLWNFPTETIYKHLAFYWPVALTVLKKLVEQTMPALATL